MSLDSWIRDYVARQARAIESVPVGEIARIIGIIREAGAEGRRIFVCGNGGNAANAAHFTTDLGKNASAASPRPFKVLSVADNDKPDVTRLAEDLASLGYALYATDGTSHALNASYVPASHVGRFSDPSPNIEEMLKAGEIQLIINTPTRGRDPERDGFKLRRMAVEYKVPCLTSVDTATALIQGLKLNRGEADIVPMGLHDI